MMNKNIKFLSQLILKIQVFILDKETKLCRFKSLLLLLTIGAAVLFSFVNARAADLPLVLIDERNLPYEFSPSNYDNSPSNYANSISNFDNSPSNFENSESNFDNSSSNFDNTINGKNRILQKRSGTLYYMGYYVVASNGTINFFSTNGQRMFYTPTAGKGVFGGKDGKFYGILANVDGQFSLALTSTGLRLLQLLQ